MTDRIIRWRWWANPLGDGEEYVEEAEASEPDYFGAAEEDDEDKRPIRAFGLFPGGTVPIRPYNSIANSFNFWEFHTTFPIGDDEEETIVSVDGVETCERYTRYRGRVAIGLAFDAAGVRRAIDAALGANLATAG